MSECPRKQARGVFRLVQMANFAEKGAWPNSGGVLEQPQAFLDLCDVVWSETEKWRADTDPLSILR